MKGNISVVLVNGKQIVARQTVVRFIFIYALMDVFPGVPKVLEDAHTFFV
jgi:hypothetical protein